MGCMYDAESNKQNQKVHNFQLRELAQNVFF